MPGLRPKKPIVADMRDPAYRQYYSDQCQKIDTARGAVSQLGGLAKPAADRTQPFGTRAQPLVQFARDEVARTKAQEPRRR
jgi:hypothetical protein